MSKQRKDRKAVTRIERTYTDAEKATALATCDLYKGRTGDHDNGISEAARVTGIPERTINEWWNDRHINADVVKIREEKKNLLAERFEGLAVALLDDLLEPGRRIAKVNEVATALGIAVDKMQLLRGEATARSESKNLNISGALPPPPPR